MLVTLGGVVAADSVRVMTILKPQGM
jgi:hypothetical protein